MVKEIVAAFIFSPETPQREMWVHLPNLYHMIIATNYTSPIPAWSIRL